MTEFWILSNFLRQSSFENAEIHELCKAVAAKYMESEKNDLRANSVREENIALRIDVDNLRQLHQGLTEAVEVQTTSEALLNDYYDEQLKMSFDVDQQEKIFRYDEIKADLETQDAINMYEELYARRIEMANKMEERQIVKKYRQKEKEYEASEKDCRKLEENLNAIRREMDQVQATTQETILHLVMGWKETEQAQTPLSGIVDKKRVPKSIEEKPPETTTPFTKRVGLSSRLAMTFKSGKIPSAVVAPRIHALSQNKGLDRLLQEAEILRKSMQATPEEKSTETKPSIISRESRKEKSRKKVTFDLITPEDEPLSGESQQVVSLLDESREKSVTSREKCVILEDVVIKPPGAPLPIKVTKDKDSPPDSTTKRKMDEDEVFPCASPETKQRHEGDTKAADVSAIVDDSRSFMDMFIDFSKDSTLEVSSILSPKASTSPCTSNKGKHTPEEVIVIDNKKSQKPKVSFEGFEEFFASLNTAGNDDDFSKGGTSFDFFDANDNTEAEAGEENFSFKF